MLKRVLSKHNKNFKKRFISIIATEVFVGTILGEEYGVRVHALLEWGATRPKITKKLKRITHIGFAHCTGCYF